MVISNPLRAAATCLAVLVFSGSAAAGPETWLDKVDPLVLAQTEHGSADFLVVLGAQADTSEALTMQVKAERGRWVLNTLRETAAATQRPVAERLESLGVLYRSYWIVNMLWAHGDRDAVRAVAAMPEVRKVLANPSVPLQLPAFTPQAAEQPESIEWNITKVGAPSVWALGFLGQNVVVAGEDTGYQWDHPALKNQYRGWNGSSADHNYNWHDAIHSGGGSCGADSPFPCDDYGHGTHTMGTMVGDDGGSNQIGMAPQARWIGCRNMNQGAGTPTSYAECFQWFIAPTDLAGNNPDPSKAPDVINNSWTCTPGEGCTDPTLLQAVVENVRAAGIVVVASAGNSGSSCSSVTDPPAIYDAAYSVGATSSSDTIASFSSRGPVTSDGSGRLKPDISAPGVSIRSSVPGGGYEGGWNGTSMAGPHVAGAVALLLSAVPSWQGQVSLIENRLSQTATRSVVPTGQVCGGIPDNVFPNNTYGFGRLDVYAAVNEADLSSTLGDWPDPVQSGNNFVYTAIASNNGPRTASDVTLTITLPDTATYVSSTGSCSLAVHVLTCSIGSLSTGSSGQVKVTVHPTAPGTIVASADVSSSLPDLTPSNNHSEQTTTVVGGLSDLAADLSASPDPALVGAQFVYTLSATNGGFVTAQDAEATLTLPAGVALVSAPADCTPGGSSVTCTLGNLAPQAVTSREITVAPSATGQPVATLAVTSSSQDGNPLNNTTDHAVEVVDMVAVGLAADESVSGGSNGNGVLEPGETVELAPTWHNPSAGQVSQTGTLLSFVGPPGAAYSIIDGTADYGTIPAGGQGACTDCYVVSLSDPDVRPTLHWDATATEQLATGATISWLVHVGHTFEDVPESRWEYPYVEEFFHHGISAGCGGAHFCPDGTLTRQQAVVQLLRANGMFAQPAWEGIFSDMPACDPDPQVFCWSRWAEEAFRQGISAGCYYNPDTGERRFCPDGVFSRQQMAVQMLRVLGVTTQPPWEDIFSDMPACDPDPQVFCWSRWAEEFFRDGLTAGCYYDPGTGERRFCPDDIVPRSHFAVFTVRGWNW